MFWGGHSGGLEVRTLSGGETRLSGRFPYGAETEISKGKREVFRPFAFGGSASSGNIHLLVHHDFDRPLASRSAGTLTVEDSEDALTFEARISPQLTQVGYVRDFLGALEAGLVGGISPGFAVPDGGAEVRRTANGILREIREARLVEISAVTLPAYPQAQIEARNWSPGEVSPKLGTPNARNRWRL